MLKMFGNKEIEFFCSEEDFGLIPAPYPARKEIPSWFKALPNKLGTQGFQTSTVKRCTPFLDALCTGYIIPLAADVEFQVNEDASGVDFSWRYHKPMVETHSFEQVSSEKSPNPILPRPPMKFLNYWRIKTPKDYSLLFVPPLNRPDPRFTCFSGLVDFPYYGLEYINFPFVWNEPGFSGLLPAGTPLVQVIPIKKDNLLSRSRSRKALETEERATFELRQRRDLVHESIYRDDMHRKV